MKRICKIFSVALAAAMMTTSAIPAVQSYAAQAQEFTYAEQKTKEQVTELQMKPGEEVDLCFLGAPNYKKYTCKWFSSNPEVATVDQRGVITAKAQGTTEIVIRIGDGTVYFSAPVTVSVISMDLTIGNASNKAMDMVELKVGRMFDLNFYGITDWSARKGKYLTEWTSSEESVATVNQSNGIVTAVAPGTSVVYFQVYDMEKEVLLSSTPVTFVVTE